jgi:hypothetical protein
MTDPTNNKEQVIAESNIGGTSGHFCLIALVQNPDQAGAFYENLAKRFQQASDAATLATDTREATLIAREQKVEQQMRALADKFAAINAITSDKATS